MKYVLKNNLIKVFNIKNLIVIFLIYFLNIFIQISDINKMDNVNILFINIFGGINDLLSNMKNFFSWTSCQIIILYLVGDFISNKFISENIYYIYRLKNKKKVIKSSIITIILINVIYYFIGFALTITGCLVFCDDFNVGLLNIINMYFMLVISGILLSILCCFVNIYLKDSKKACVVIVFMSYISVECGYIFSCDKVLPLNQGILLKHYLNESFSYMYSYLYTGLCILILSFIISYKTIKIDTQDMINY